jgi:hypothetical protein
MLTAFDQLALHIGAFGQVSSDSVSLRHLERGFPDTTPEAFTLTLERDGRIHVRVHGHGQYRITNILEAVLWLKKLQPAAISAMTPKLAVAV